MTSGWGYGNAYYNPYYAQPVATTAAPYDYSQPIVVNNYISPETEAAEAPVQIAQDSPASQQGLTLFDEGLSQFKSGAYQEALVNFDAALRQLPGDPVVHEVRALALFASGDYKQAGAALNSFLSSAPGMDWTTMSSLYGNTDDYTLQLRNLEQYCQSHPNDAAAYFVLAYHYLTTGSKDNAVQALNVVVKNQPKDYIAKRMLDALAPPQLPPAPTTIPPAAVDSDVSETDLVGDWRAKAGDTTIDLAITEESHFVWKAIQPGKPALELQGNLVSTSDELAFESEGKGAMTGSVMSLGADKWKFALSGAPPLDPGLHFARVKN
jgi:tetratricopeptide (TPR) repeat protein